MIFLKIRILVQFEHCNSANNRVLLIDFESLRERVKGRDTPLNIPILLPQRSQYTTPI